MWQQLLTVATHCPVGMGRWAQRFLLGMWGKGTLISCTITLSPILSRSQARSGLIAHSSKRLSRVRVLGLTASQMPLLKQREQSDKKASSNFAHVGSTRQMSMKSQAPVSSGVHTSSTFLLSEWSTIFFSKIRHYFKVWPIFLIESGHSCCSLWLGELFPHELSTFWVGLLDLTLGEPRHTDTDGVIHCVWVKESAIQETYELVPLISFYSNLSDPC